MRRIQGCFNAPDCPSTCAPTTAGVTTAASAKNGKKKYLTCSRCGVAKYCSKTCQVAHWKRKHKRECRPFVARRVEGYDGGIGVFATKKIKKGDLVLKERALLITTLDALDSDVARLSEIDRKRLFSLCDAHKRTPTDKKTALGIFKTNGYPVGRNGGIFTTFARFNSSCTPNVTFRCTPQGVLRVYAAKDVERGSELFNCYLNPAMPTKERQAELEKKFKFRCACETCTRADPTSDARRAEIRRLDDEIYNHISRGRYEKGEAAVKRSLKLLEQEGLDNPATRARLAFDGYQGRQRAKDEAGMRRWLRVMLENQKLSDDPKGSLKRKEKKKKKKKKKETSRETLTHTMPQRQKGAKRNDVFKEHISAIRAILRKKASSDRDGLVRKLRNLHEDLKAADQDVASAALNAKTLRNIIKLMSPDDQSLFRPTFRRNKDIQILLASIYVDILRLSAPEPPYEKAGILKVFGLLVSHLEGAEKGKKKKKQSKEDAAFEDERRYYVLESLSNIKSCLILVALCEEELEEEEDENEEETREGPATLMLINFFRALFSMMERTNAGSLSTRNRTDMYVVDILQACVEEFDDPSAVPKRLLDCLLSHAVESGEGPMGESLGPSSRSYRVVKTVLKQQLVQQPIRLYLKHLVASGNMYSPRFRKLVAALYAISPDLLVYALPTICKRLTDTDSEERFRSVQLLAGIFGSSSECLPYAEDQHFQQLLSRCRDKDPRIRRALVSVCSNALASYSQTQDIDAIAFFEQKLRSFLVDPNVEVRAATVYDVCDVALENIEIVSKDLLYDVGNRCKDKSVDVCRDAITGLVQVYRAWSYDNEEEVEDGGKRNAEGPTPEDRAMRESSKSAATRQKLNFVPGLLFKCLSRDDFKIKDRVLQLFDDILLPKNAATSVRASGLLDVFTIVGSDKHVDRALFESILRVRVNMQAMLRKFLTMKTEKVEDDAAETPSSLEDNASSAASPALRMLQTIVNKALPALASKSRARLTNKFFGVKDKNVWRALSTLADPTASLKRVRETRSKLLSAIGSKSDLSINLVRPLIRRTAMIGINADIVADLIDYACDHVDGTADERKRIVCALDLIERIADVAPQIFGKLGKALECLTMRMVDFDRRPYLLETCVRILCSVGAMGTNETCPFAVRLTEKTRDTLIQCIGSSKLDDGVKRIATRAFLVHFPSNVRPIEVLIKKCLRTPKNVSGALAEIAELASDEILAPMRAKFWQLIDRVMDDDKGSTAYGEEIRIRVVDVAIGFALRKDSDSATGTRVLDLLRAGLETSTGAMRCVFIAGILELATLYPLSIDIYHAVARNATHGDSNVRTYLLGRLESGLLGRSKTKRKLPPLMFMAILPLFANDANASIRERAASSLTKMAKVQHRVFQSWKMRAIGTEHGDENAQEREMSVLMVESMIPYALHLMSHMPGVGGDSDMDNSLMTSVLEDESCSRTVARLLKATLTPILQSKDQRKGVDLCKDLMSAMLRKIELSEDAFDRSCRNSMVLASIAQKMLRDEFDKDRYGLRDRYPGKIFLPSTMFTARRRTGGAGERGDGVASSGERAAKLPEVFGLALTPAKKKRRSPLRQQSAARRSNEREDRKRRRSKKSPAQSSSATKKVKTPPSRVQPSRRARCTHSMADAEHSDEEASENTEGTAVVDKRRENRQGTGLTSDETLRDLQPRGARVHAMDVVIIDVMSGKRLKLRMETPATVQILRESIRRKFYDNKSEVAFRLIHAGHEMIDVTASLSDLLREDTKIIHLVCRKKISVPRKKRTRELKIAEDAFSGDDEDVEWKCPRCDGKDHTGRTYAVVPWFEEEEDEEGVVGVCPIGASASVSSANLSSSRNVK
eukprot:g449.t1